MALSLHRALVNTAAASGADGDGFAMADDSGVENRARDVARIEQLEHGIDGLAEFLRGTEARVEANEHLTDLLRDFAVGMAQAIEARMIVLGLIEGEGLGVANRLVAHLVVPVRPVVTDAMVEAARAVLPSTHYPTYVNVKRALEAAALVVDVPEHADEARELLEQARKALYVVADLPLNATPGTIVGARSVALQAHDLIDAHLNAAVGVPLHQDTETGGE